MFVVWQNWMAFSGQAVTWLIFIMTIVKIWKLLDAQKAVQKNECGMITKAVTSTLSLISFCAWFTMYSWQENN
jgi:hypothetical protein